jgi:uncharacterized protein YaaQ
MKLIIAIVKDSDLEPVSRALTSNSFRVTLIASTGGFLRRGSTTLLIGVEDDQVQQGLDLIRKNCAPAVEPNSHRGTIFVIPVEQYIRV